MSTLNLDTNSIVTLLTATTRKAANDIWVAARLNVIEFLLLTDDKQVALKHLNSLEKFLTSATCACNPARLAQAVTEAEISADPLAGVKRQVAGYIGGDTEDYPLTPLRGLLRAVEVCADVAFDLVGGLAGQAGQPESE